MSENPSHAKNRAVRITALVAALLVVAGLIVYALTTAEKSTVDTAQPATETSTVIHTVLSTSA